MWPLGGRRGNAAVLLLRPKLSHSELPERRGISPTWNDSRNARSPRGGFIQICLPLPTSFHFIVEDDALAIFYASCCTTLPSHFSPAAYSSLLVTYHGLT